MPQLVGCVVVSCVLGRIQCLQEKVYLMVQGSALMLMLYMALLMILIRIEFWSTQETQQLVLI